MQDDNYLFINKNLENSIKGFSLIDLPAIKKYKKYIVSIDITICIFYLIMTILKQYFAVKNVIQFFYI